MKISNNMCIETRGLWLDNVFWYAYTF